MTGSGRRETTSDGPAGAVRETAFALLLAGRRPVTPAAIAAALAVPGPTLDTILVDLAASGWIDRDDDGAITGAAGLSLTDGPHRLTLGTAEFRNWCAYDSLGIAAALEADATVTTACPVCGTGISIAIEAGCPPADRSERLWLADGGADLRADFCAPTVLLCSVDHAEAWAGRQGGRGRVVDLREATTLGREAWQDCARSARRVADG